MKKKMIFALLLAGMSFVAPNVADAQEKVVAPANGTNLVAAGGHEQWYDFYVTCGGITANIYGCWGSGHGCYVGG